MTTPPPPPSPPSGPESPLEETDPRFPSGPWTGFFLMEHWPGRHQMELHLSFRQGAMSGEGRDRIGPFLIRGKYTLGDGKCHWTKRYIGKHDVAYQGYNEGKGIWGLWEIPPSSKGGFHIWPEGMGDPTNPLTCPRRSTNRRTGPPCPRHLPRSMWASASVPASANPSRSARRRMPPRRRA